MRVLLLLLLSAWAPIGAAQTMYKCLDDNRRVTYSNVPCDKQGLKDGGAVADRTTTMPLGPLPTPAKPAAKAPASRDAKDGTDSKDSKGSRDETESMKRGAPLTPVVPLLEKLSK